MLASSLEKINLGKLEKLGTYAFYSTRLTKLSLPATVESIAPGAFITKAFNSTDANILRIAEITIDDACETYFTDDRGAVYRKLENGMYELVAYPSGSAETGYTVLEGTVRIDELPDTITLAEVAQVEYLNRLYNAMDSEQISFVTNSEKLKAAVKVAEQLRRDNPTVDPVTPNPEPSDPGDSSETGDSTETKNPSETTGEGVTGENGNSEQKDSGFSVVWIIIPIAAVSVAAVAVILVLKKKKGGNADA